MDLEGPWPEPLLQTFNPAGSWQGKGTHMSTLYVFLSSLLMSSRGMICAVGTPKVPLYAPLKGNPASPALLG